MGYFVIFVFDVGQNLQYKKMYGIINFFKSIFLLNKRVLFKFNFFNFVL